MKKTFIISTLLLLSGFFFTPNTVLAGKFKDKLTDDNWIILEIPIPFPGCSNAGLKDFVKCCDDGDIKNYYTEKLSGLQQTYKAYLPVCPSGSVAAVKDVPSFIMVVVQFITILIIVMMVLLLMVSGIQYITSRGNPAGAQKSKDRVTHAAFGLVVVLFSSVILYQVNPSLLTLTIDKPGQIKEAQIVYHCAEEGTTPCGEGVRGDDMCIGRKCESGNYCAETVGDDDKSSFECVKLIELGNDCENNEMCKSGFCAPSSVDKSKNVCSSVEALLNARCETNADCNGLICQTNFGNTCTFGKQGNPCSTNSECDISNGYFCFTSAQYTGANFCSLAKVSYGVCDVSSNCKAGELCVEASYYNTYAGQFGSDNDQLSCIPVKPTDVTAPQEVYDCNTNNDCLASKFGTPYCNTWGDNFCTKGLIGNVCENGTQCVSGYCDTKSRTCSDGKVGDSCGRAQDCASNYCWLSKTGGSYCLINPSTGSGGSNSPLTPTGNQMQQ